MSLSDPKNKDPYNSGAVRATSFGDATVPFTTTASPLSQIRGISAKGSTGAGIPKHVTNVAASTSNASTGTTNAISVTFSRDPSDTSHSKVNVYVKGYQGNSSPVQVASGSESPVTFVLNNTGEAISVLVQSQGNSGEAPLATAPSTGVRLPVGVGGGYSVTTVTNTPPSSAASLTNGFMFGAGSLVVPFINGSGSPNSGVADRVRVCKFSIAIGISFSKCSVQITNANVARLSFGIYSLSGDKIFDSGIFVGPGASGALTNSITPVTLPAGTYYAAQTADNNPGNIGVDVLNIGGAGQLAANVGSAVILGKAANPSVAGALPATLGAITTDSDGTFAVPLWEA